VSKYLAAAILRELANYKLKLDDAPCSAVSHFDHAVFLLSEECADLNIEDPEMIQTINDSREHMAFYYEEAKEPLPKNT